MAFGQFIDPDTGTYTDDHLIARAFESLRAEFGQKIPDFQAFVAANRKRAELVLRIEGRSTDLVVRALRPFAEGACDARARVEADGEFRRALYRKGANQ